MRASVKRFRRPCHAYREGAARAGASGGGVARNPSRAERAAVPRRQAAPGEILCDLGALAANTFPGPPLDESPSACGREYVVRNYFGSAVGGVPATGGGGLAGALHAAGPDLDGPREYCYTIKG